MRDPTIEAQRADNVPVGGSVPGLLSVIIPTLDGADRITGQLEALSRQAYAGPWELIIADNGSTDGTALLAEAWADRLPVRVLDASRRRGPAAARNDGAEFASGERLAFIDDDDVVEDGWLAAMASGVADLLGGAVARPGTAATAPQTYTYLPYALGGNMGVRREAFRTLGGFDESLLAGEDLDFSWRAQLAGFTFEQVPGARLTATPRDGLAAGFKQYAAFARSEVELYSRYRHHGMRRDGKRLVRRLAWMARHLPEARSDAWVKSAATLWGWMQGSMAKRTMYFGGS